MVGQLLLAWWKYLALYSNMRAVILTHLMRHTTQNIQQENKGYIYVMTANQI